MERTLGAVELTLLALALGTDAFSVALGVGTAGITARRMFRLSWHFGLFQFLMPILGWLLGRQLAELVGSVGHVLVGVFLAYVGGRMIVESVRSTTDDRLSRDRTRGWALVLFSVATSLDALGVGVGLGILGLAIILPAFVIGVVAAGMTALGMVLGDRLRVVVGRRAETLGGLVLLGLAVRFIVA